MSAVPERANRGKGGAQLQSDDPEPSRREAMERQGREPDYPHCDAAYLAGYLWEVGPVLEGGMGPVTLTQVEVAAWQANTGVYLSSWEVRTLRRMSSAYLAEMSRAKSPAARSPWFVQSVEERRPALALRVRDALRD